MHTTVTTKEIEIKHFGMNDIHLEHKVIEKLINAGWESNRFVQIDVWKEELSNFGLKSNIFADNLLKELGNIKVGTLNFNPILETSLMFEELKEINDESGFNFFPIGVHEKEELMITVNEKGQIFGFLSNIVLKYGNSLENSLNNLLSGQGDIECLDWEYEKW